ncbi:MAG: hypothetical protein RPR40_03210, partial [Bermanella sp.]
MEYLQFEFKRFTDRSYPFIDLSVNIPPELSGMFVCYKLNSLTVEWTLAGGVGRSYIRLNSATMTEPHKIIFLPAAEPGVWVNNDFSYTAGATELNLTEPPGAVLAPTHQVGGVCQHDGTPF